MNSDKLEYSDKYSSLALDCYYVEFNGSEFSPCHRRFFLTPLEGRVQISSLDVYPSKYMNDCEANERYLANLTKQGEEFITCSKIRHMFCTGRTVIEPPDGSEEKICPYSEEVDSQVIIDFEQAFQAHSEWSPDLSLMTPCNQNERETIEMTVEEETICGIIGHCFQMDCCQNEYIIQDYKWDRLLMDDLKRSDPLLRSVFINSADELSEEYYKLLPNRVFGYILRSRKWGTLAHA